MLYKLLTIISALLFIPIFILSFTILIIISIIYLPWFYKLDKLFCRAIMSTFFIWPKITGNFPKSGTYIIMMNHSSFLDVFLFPLITSGSYTGITAKNNFKIPLFSTLLRRIKAIPIDRQNRQSAINSIKIAENVLNQGTHIGILPEGTRTTNGLMGPLKKGGFHMAINTNTSIVPVGIIGAFKFKPKNRWWIHPCPITINIGEVIDLPKENCDMNSFMMIVEKKLKELSFEK